MVKSSVKIKLTLYICLLLSGSCKNEATNNAAIVPNSNNVIANEFIDAFYSFNRDSLESMLALAKESQPNILYYQKWAECGDYKIVKRDSYFEKNDSLVIFPVIVKDDLMSALNIDFNVTDTFRISIRNGQIRAVHTSSNDPDIYYEAKEWVKQNRPGLVEKACEGIWNGGPTPCECVRGMVKGFAEFAATK
jgi:hypothetical protein